MDSTKIIIKCVKSPDKMKKCSLSVFNMSSNVSNSNDLIRSFEKGLNKEGEWELKLEKKYNDEQIISIMNMLSFLENEHNGFNHFNDKSLYEEERKADVTGLLYEEASRGFKISKKNIDMQNEIHNKKIMYTLKEC